MRRGARQASGRIPADRHYTAGPGRFEPERAVGLALRVPFVSNVGFPPALPTGRSPMTPPKSSVAAVAAPTEQPFDLGHFIGGRAVAGASGRKGKVHNPATGQVRGDVAFASAEETRAAIAAAEAASSFPTKQLTLLRIGEE